MEAYLDIINNVLKEGVRCENRTGIDTFVIPGAHFQHDMSKGFPLLTTKSMPFKCIASELEFFIKGITDKQWLKDRKNHIWDEWASPILAPYGHSNEAKAAMAAERDLGPIYGFNWRHFGTKYRGYDKDYEGEGVDQLANIVKKLEEDPTDRRMLCTAWDPTKIGEMALPPCHYGFQVTTTGDKLNLFWNQRSVDTMLGLPFNIASYALLLHLLAKQNGFEEGTLNGFLADVQIYENHIEGAQEQLKRDPLPLCKIETEKFDSIFNWEYEDSKRVNYEHHPKINFDIAI